MNIKSDFGELLEKNRLKKTSTRLSVLSILKSRKSAISLPELETLLGKTVDRVTLYRTLLTFEEKGIIHKVLNLNGTANYAACSSECNENDHNDEHVHFNCTVCLNVYCLEALQIPHLVMPPGFTPESMNFIAYGKCESCNKKAVKYSKRKKP